jgi:hypothetical protein
LLLRLLGPLLLIAGLAGLWLGEVGYDTEKELLDAGPLQVKTRERETIEIPPLAAGAVAALGGALTAVAFRRS